MTPFAAVLVFAAITFAQSGIPANPPEADPPEANPGRPTVSNPARLPPAGYLQMEQGFVQANGSPELDSQFSVNQVMKLAVHPRLMLQLLSQPVALTRMAGSTDRSTGDLQLGAQVLLRQPSGHVPAIAAGYIRRVRSGTAADLDIGGFVQSGIILLTGDAGGFHYDGNLLLSEQTAGRVRRAQHGQTLSVTHGLCVPKLALSGEIWHFTQPLVVRGGRGGNHAAGLLWALGYTVRPNLVLDAGFAQGLTATSTRWQGFAGFTYLLPHRLWRSR